VPQRSLTALKRYDRNGHSLIGINEEGVRIANEDPFTLTTQFQTAYPNLSLTDGDGNLGPFAFKDEFGYVEDQLCRLADGSPRPSLNGDARYDYLDADGFPSFGGENNSFMRSLYQSVAGLSPDFYSGLEDEVSKEARDYYRNVVLRFRADNDRALKPSAYLEFLNSEWWSLYNTFYINGGLSRIIYAMNEAYEENGGKPAFLNTEISHIIKTGDKYLLRNKDNSKHFFASHVVIAADIASLNKIQGNVAAQVKNTSEFRAIAGNLDTDNSGVVKVVTVHHIWDRNWWDGDEAQALLATDEDSAPINRHSDSAILRADTNNLDVCNNVIELPPTDYYSDRKVTRSVYSDVLECYNKYEQDYKTGGTDKVNERALAGLAFMFPNVFGNNVAEEDKPKILHTVVKFIPAAWVTISTEKNNTITTTDVLDWSKQPLPNEQVYLVGGAYTNGFGWSNSAYLSSSIVLREKFKHDAPEIALEGLQCGGDGTINYDLDPWLIYPRS
jgi:hypothetical protein